MIRASIFLLLGAIVNVAVAWGCVCWSPWSATRVLDHYGEVAWQAPVPEDYPATASHYRDVSFGITNFHAYGGLPRDPQKHLDARAAKDKNIDDLLQFLYVRGTFQYVLQAGLPMRSLYAQRHDVQLSKAGSGSIIAKLTDWREGVAIPEWVPWCDVRLNRALPTQPIWIGFITNTSIYAVSLGMLWMCAVLLIEVRTRRRSCRSLCSACKYPIGDSPVCTECGAAVNSQRKKT